ncbi:MAG: TetR/AcrR family transcriptional regulator [Polyangiales bacterium]
MPGREDQKQETHERIVQAAARAVRRRGYDGVGVAELMNEIGLTHGGFYAHFKSKTALLAAAADRAGLDGIQSLAKAARAAVSGKARSVLIDSYLSDVHLKTPELGCPIAAVGSEMPRQAPEVRSAATRRIKELITLIERQLPGAQRRDNALVTLSLLVGTMVIARAVDDPALAKAVRKAAREHLKRTLPEDEA